MSTWGPPTPRFGNHSYNTINEARCRGREQEDTAFIFVGQRFGYCLLSVNTSTDTETSSSFNDCDGKCQHIHICLCSAVCLRCHWMFFLQTFSVKKKKPRVQNLLCGSSRSQRLFDRACGWFDDRVGVDLVISYGKG